MMQPAVPETRQLREERIQRARPPSYEYGIEILATLYVVSSYYNWIHSLLTPSCYLRWYLFACSQSKDKEIMHQHQQHQHNCQADYIFLLYTQIVASPDRHGNNN